MLSSGAVGCDDTGAYVGVEQSEIVGGVAASDDAVVALTYNDHVFCSGTLVSRRTVVTAAHCLPPHLDLPVDSIEVFFGDEIRTEGVSIPVVDVLVDPSWAEDAIPGDIGVVALAEDAPVQPALLAYEDLDTWMDGEQVRLVGFGITARDGGGGGLKREGTARIQGITASSLHMGPEPSVTCSGDSGGPLFAVRDGVELLAGVHSRSDCDEHSIAERIDVHAMSFVMPFIEEHEGPALCEADGLCASGCAEPDPDCPCVADGLCTDACPDPAADVDCADPCADGSCEPTGSGADTPADDEPEPAELSGCAAGGHGAGAASVLALLALLAHAQRRLRPAPASSRKRR